MSVPVGRRGKSKLEACAKAHELCCYTIQLTANDKIFIEKYRRALGDRIVETAMTIYVSAMAANDINVRNAADAKERLSLQKRAINNCRVLLYLVDLAYRIYKLRSKRIQYWCGLILKTRELLAAWHKSDFEKYREMLK